MEKNENKLAIITSEVLMSLLEEESSPIYVGKPEMEFLVDSPLYKSKKAQDRALATLMNIVSSSVNKRQPLFTMSRSILEEAIKLDTFHSKETLPSGSSTIDGAIKSATLSGWILKIRDSSSDDLNDRRAPEYLIGPKLWSILNINDENINFIMRTYGCESCIPMLNQSLQSLKDRDKVRSILNGDKQAREITPLTIVENKPHKTLDVPKEIEDINKEDVSKKEASFAEAVLTEEEEYHIRRKQQDEYQQYMQSYRIRRPEDTDESFELRLQERDRIEDELYEIEERKRGRHYDDLN